MLLVGDKAWPFPIPLVREGGAWRFATERGAEEILNRRIGRNERNALYVLQAYVDAQREYASRDRDGDGVLQYAAKLGSSPGKFDGLYWPADASKNEEASPFGPLIAQSAAYLAGRSKGDAYRGYHFRILTRQGKAAAGRRLQLRDQRPHDRRLRDGRLPGPVRRERRDDLHRQPATARSSRRISARTRAAIAEKMTVVRPGPRLEGHAAVRVQPSHSTLPVLQGDSMKQPSLIIAAASLLVAFGLPAARASRRTRRVMASSPGKASIAQKRKIVATVEAIDVAKREVTLKGPKGKVVPLVGGTGRAQPRAGQGRRPASW